MAIDKIKLKNWGKGQMDLTHLGPVLQGGITEIHYKTDGAKDDNGSIAIVIELQTGLKVVTEISVNTLSHALLDTYDLSSGFSGEYTITKHED